MLTASRTATLASGEKPDRAALYQEVADLVAAGGIADAAAIAETTVRIAGLGAELLHDERTLKDRCGRFGEVLEATVYAPWSLVTFGEPDGAQKALDGVAAELGEGVTAQRMASEPQGEPSSTGGGVAEEMAARDEHRRRLGLAQAVAAVAPLIDSVVCADASRVDSAEAQEACLTLSSLMLLDPVRVCAEFLRDERYIASSTAPNSALGAVYAKDATDLSSEDTMLAACDLLATTILLGPNGKSKYYAAAKRCLVLAPLFSISVVARVAG